MRCFFFMLVTWTFIYERECVSPQDIEECGRQHFAVVRCTSVNFFYRECLVPGAVQITAIKLHTKISKYACDFKDSFGYRLNNVWVTNGCSGEFYLCYNGERVTTTTKKSGTHIHTHAVTTESPTTKRTQGKTTSGSNVEVVKGSTAAEETDVLIYVIVASCVVLVVAIGLIVGCVVKRRQQNDKSRHLAAKRQIRIELKEHREHMEENGVAMLPLTPGSFPLATRSLSVESINYGESVNYNYGFKHDNEREGSIDSSRSSISGMTSASAMTTGHMYRSSPSWDGSNSTRQSFGILKKGLSTSDISMLGRMYCDSNTMSRQSKSSLMRHSRSSLARCSQSSLESVREVCSKYQVFDIPLERKLEQQSKRHSQFNTVGFSSDRNAQNRNARNPKYNTLGHSRGISESVSTNSQMQLKPVDRLSANINTTQALVHRSPSIKSHTSQTISTISANVPMPKETKMVSLPSRLQNPVLSVDNAPRDASAKTDNFKPRDTHYHDPTSLILQSKTPQVKHVTLSPARPLSPTVRISKPEVIYGTVNKEKRIKPVILPKPSSTIYATVNKSYFKAASRADYTDISYDIKTLEDDEEDLQVPEIRDNQYARLDAFRSESVLTHPVPVVRVPEMSTGATNC